MPEVCSKVSEHTRQRIVTLVTKHLHTQYRLPISATMQQAIAPALERLAMDAARRRPLLLDAGCGTGSSTRALALIHPDATVIGVDRSEVRLRKAPPLPENAFLLRARLEEFWLLAQRAGIVFAKTYLLYPNPYPKHWQLQRRWHGHPIFPVILATTRAIELRTNQEWYAEEFSLALSVLGWEYTTRLLDTDDVLTPFERKYAARGHVRVVVQAERPSQLNFT
jgi:tRNA G46 methylase TrmB